MKKTKLGVILILCAVFLLFCTSDYIGFFKTGIEKLVETEMKRSAEIVSAGHQNYEFIADYTSSDSVNISGYIKWVDFNVTYEALNKALKLDIKYYDTENPMPWISTLAFLACKYGGDFSSYKNQDIVKLEEKVKNGETFEELTADMKSYSYYYEAYSAVLGGFVGEYEIIGSDGGSLGKRYGLKAYSPIASGFSYSHYEDFGTSRSYGYARKHLGHDILGSVGTPIIAIESGVVEAIGWNQYGGWRVGIRSFDGKRYYYYAHLKKDHPYHQNLKVGQIIMAGDVVGYMGMTGYSAKENVNNINIPHLHVGMEVMFDEAQKDAVCQIWIDLYAITKLLSQNTSTVYKDYKSNEYFRKYTFSERIPENAQVLADRFKNALQGGE